MIVGILSDTHGRLDPARRAVEILVARGAEYLVHCGDVGGEDILDLLVGVGQGAAFVFGNNDLDRDGLSRYARSIGVTCLDELGAIELRKKRLAVTHGDFGRFVRAALADERTDYLLVGHTHHPRDERVGRVRVINPGALHRASPKTVAVLDLETDKLDFIDLGH